MTSSIDFLRDRDTDSVILLNLIKGSNLRLEICVCSVVSTVETSGAAGKWWDFYCIFCCAIRVSFFISFYQKNPLLHKKITVGEYLQKRRQALSSIVTIVLSEHRRWQRSTAAAIDVADLAQRRLLDYSILCNDSTN